MNLSQTKHLFSILRRVGRRLLQSLRSMWPAVVVLTLIECNATVRAGVPSQIAKETADYVMARFGSKAIREGGEALTSRIGRFASKYGEEFIPAIRNVGPRAFELTEMAGEHAPQAVRVMAEYGEEGVTQVLSRKTSLALLEKFGESAAAAMVKHPGIGESLIEKLGPSGIRALESTTPQAARRLSMLVESGELTKIGHSEELLEVIGKYGSKAMDFVWKNKESLAVATVLAAFLQDPAPFIEGTKEITKTVAENVAKPLAEVPAQVAEEAARRIDWTPVVLVVLAFGGLFVSIKTNLLRSVFRSGKASSSILSQAAIHSSLVNPPINSPTQSRDHNGASGATRPPTF